MLDRTREIVYTKLDDFQVDHFDEIIYNIKGK